jgi:phage baseplate assembly protein W
MEDVDGFLGRGWSFPPEFKHRKNAVVLTGGELDIEKSLEILITTRKNERLMRPNFGCDLSEYVFESLSSTNINSIKKTVEEAILLFEPRIDLLKVGLDITNFTEGKLLIGLDYVIRSTNTRRNLVFPYYLNEATDV